MVSIGQNLTFRAAQLNSTQKTVQTEENTVENKTAANQTALNTSEGGAKTIMPSTELLLVNNGIKINKPEADNPSMEVNANHHDYGDDYDRMIDEFVSGKLDVDDTLRYCGKIAMVVIEDGYRVILFADGSRINGPLLPV